MFRQLMLMLFCVLLGAGDAFAGTPNPFRVEAKNASAALDRTARSKCSFMYQRNTISTET